MLYQDKSPKEAITEYSQIKEQHVIKLLNEEVRMLLQKYLKP